YVIASALNFHLAARGIPLDAAAGMVDANDSRNGFYVDVAFHVRNSDVAGGAGHVNIAPDIAGGHGATRSGEIGVAVDFFHANCAGSGVDFYRAAQIANVLRA